MNDNINKHNNVEYMANKNNESLKYIEKHHFTEDELFKKVLSSNGNNKKEVLNLLEDGLVLIPEEQNKAKIYFLVISLLDDIAQELSSIATDIMLYIEEKNNENIPKEFSSIEDIRTILAKYK